MTKVESSDQTVRFASRLPRILGNMTALTLLLAWALIIVTPLFWLVMSSLKPVSEIFTARIQWIPTDFQFENYLFVATSRDFLRYSLNSAFVSILSTVLTVVVCSMAGYGLAKFRFPGDRIVLGLILSSIMVPFQVLMVPLFVVTHRLGLVNTLWGLVLPSGASAFGVFLIRQTIVSIPQDGLDAARVDGCTELGVFVRVVVPLSKVGLVTLAVLAFLGNWNEIIWPIIIIFSEELWTLPLALTNISSNPDYGIRYDRIMTLAVMMTVPVVLLYLFLSRYIVDGIRITGARV